MPGSRTVRVGIVGAGANTRARHLPGLRAIEGVEVISVCNRTLESSKRVAREFGIPRVHSDWLDLVQDEDIDAVVVGTWPNMHHAVTTAALASGKHVLCEARMAMNSQEALEMLEVSRAHPELVAQLVPSPLSFRVDKTIQRLIATGHVGTVLAADVVFRTGEFLDTATPLQWRKDRAISGNNVIALGIWYETLMRWIGRASSVFALSQIGDASQPDRVPDHLEVIARMENGALTRIQMSTLAGLDPANRATIYGSEATLQFRDNVLFLGKRADQELREVPIASSDEGHWNVEEDFINAIRDNGEVTLTDFETGLAYMQFTDAVWKSLDEGRSVELPLDTAVKSASIDP